MISKLVNSTSSSTLKPSQIKELITLLRDDPLMIHSLGLTPDIWLLILDKNPSLAKELLIMKRLSLEFQHYFVKLNALPLSLAWIECIYLLAPSLDTQELYQSVSRKITECLNETDHHKVLLLVKLIQSLAQMLPQFLVDLKPELESFCIHFAKIKQVSSLYKDLNKYESI